MTDSIDYIELVKKAQVGDKECLNRLAEVASVRLREYVQRLTLQEDLTEDIVQESILEMFKVFDKLKKTERFWHWLDGIAFNKVRGHYGRQWRHKTVSLSDAGSEIAGTDSSGGVADMVTTELKEIVVKSMRQLQPRHRAVLTMRCYKGMKYSEIAELMECSELGAQALFYRAKKALAKRLSHYGFGKGSLLAALVLFGKMTARSEAAAAKVSVTAASTKVGVAAGMVGMLGSKTTVVCLATVGVLGVGTLVATSGLDRTIAGSRDRPQSNSHLAGQARQAKGAIEECWYYFPRRADGPVMMRTMKSDSKGRWSYCAWRQNEQANYYFDNRRNTVYIKNCRMWRNDLSVRRMPTDEPQLRQFLSKVEGRAEELGYTPLRGEGLLVMTRSDTNGDTTRQRVIQHHYILDSEQFRYDWPAGLRVVDNRDAMHKRGWTYFKVEGRIGEERVSGTGRIPFVYAASAEHGPWLRLKVGERRRFVDAGDEALVFNGSTVVASYPGGSFFKGLTRPWMGLHTIDTVRRDAAEQQVRFETKHNASDEETEVKLTCEQGKLVYTIDMEKDVIDKITFLAVDGEEGELTFTYFQNIDEAGDEFIEPRIRRSYGSKRRKSAGMRWLFKIAVSG